MKKFLSLSLLFVLLLVVLAGCGKEEVTTEPVVEPAADVVAAATSVTDQAGFLNSVSANGTWIIIPLNDITIDQEIVVEGTFYNKNDTTQNIYRKIAPYTQDADKNVTGRFTITAPKMTIKSPNTKLQGGTFVGDIYVEANGFVVQDATVQGNVYFASEEFKTSFDMSKQGVVTGVTEVKAAVDAVAAATSVTDQAGFLNSVSVNGTWIIIPLNDITIDQEVVVEGTFYNKNDTTQNIYRKIAPYTQDADKNVTGRFTITAPKMTIKSPNTKLQGGTFVGDIYVEANGFVVQDATVQGNVYFASEEFKASFDMSNKGTVTGVTEVK